MADRSSMHLHWNYDCFEKHSVPEEEKCLKNDPPSTSYYACKF